MYNIRIILTFKECMGEYRFEFKQGKISPLEYLNLKHHKYTRKKRSLVLPWENWVEETICLIYFKMFWFRLTWFIDAFTYDDWFKILNRLLTSWTMHGLKNLKTMYHVSFIFGGIEIDKVIELLLIKLFLLRYCMHI